MAHYDEIGEYGLNQVLARRLTTPGGAVAPTVAPELFPTLVLENDRPEWSYPKGELRAGARVTLGASGGNYNALQLYLPSTARSICIVTDVFGNSGTGGANVQRAQGIGAGVAGWIANVTQPADFRWPLQTQTILERYTGALAALGNGTIDRISSAGNNIKQPIIVAPGTALLLVTDIVNSALDITVRWYERTAQPGELI